MRCAAAALLYSGKAAGLRSGTSSSEVLNLSSDISHSFLTTRTQPQRYRGISINVTFSSIHSISVIQQSYQKITLYLYIYFYQSSLKRRSWLSAGRETARTARPSAAGAWPTSTSGMAARTAGTACIRESAATDPGLLRRIESAGITYVLFLALSVNLRLRAASGLSVAARRSASSGRARSRRWRPAPPAHSAQVQVE